MKKDKQSVNVAIPDHVIVPFIDEYLTKLFKGETYWHESLDQNLYIKLIVEGMISEEPLPQYEDDWE